MNSPLKPAPQTVDVKPACHSDNPDERRRLQLLFDSVTPQAHAEARQLCGACPVIASCRKLLEATKRDYGYGPSVGPQGTWAGELVGDMKQSRQPCADAGTPRGHTAHRTNKTAVCDDCAEWNRQYRAEWRAGRAS